MFFLFMTQISYDKHISESLGAQMNPDISWTSSLNTPPPVPSTLILSKPGLGHFKRKTGDMFDNLSPFNVAAKTDESLCPASVSADQNVVVSTNMQQANFLSITLMTVT